MAVSLLFTNKPNSHMRDLHSVTDFKSHRFMKLFLSQEINLQNARRNTQAIKKHIKQQVTIINNSTKKFFIEGWFKQDMKIVGQSAQKKTQKKLTLNNFFLTFIYLHLTQLLTHQLLNGLMLIRNLPMSILVKIVHLHPPPLHHIFLNLYVYLPLFVIYKYYISK
jgi:hypothetical protein